MHLSLTNAPCVHNPIRMRIPCEHKRPSRSSRRGMQQQWRGGRLQPASVRGPIRFSVHCRCVSCCFILLRICPRLRVASWAQSLHPFMLPNTACVCPTLKSLERGAERRTWAATWKAVRMTACSTCVIPSPSSSTPRRLEASGWKRSSSTTASCRAACAARGSTLYASPRSSRSPPAHPRAHLPNLAHPVLSCPTHPSTHPPSHPLALPRPHPRTDEGSGLKAPTPRP